MMKKRKKNFLQKNCESEKKRPAKKENFKAIEVRMMMPLPIMLLMNR
jgi:hypothetical protein